MTDVGTLPAAVDGLRQTVAVLRRQNTPDLADIADALERYLNPLADISLDAALGLHPVPGAEHWRTAARRAIRDNELRALVDAFLPGLSVRRAADEVTRLIASYRIRWGRADQHSATMPASYVGRPEQHLYRAFRTGIVMPGVHRLRTILARQLGDIDAPLSMSGSTA